MFSLKPGTPGLTHRIGGIEKNPGTGNLDYSPQAHQAMTDARKGLEMCQSELARERAGEATYWFPTSARPAGDQRPVAIFGAAFGA